MRTRHLTAATLAAGLALAGVACEGSTDEQIGSEIEEGLEDGGGEGGEGGEDG